MIFALIALVGVTIYEVYRLLKRGEKREATIYIVFSILTFAFGVYMTLTPTYVSFVAVIMNLLGIQY